MPQQRLEHGGRERLLGDGGDGAPPKLAGEDVRQHPRGHLHAEHLLHELLLVASQLAADGA